MNKYYFGVLVYIVSGILFAADEPTRDSNRKNYIMKPGHIMVEEKKEQTPVTRHPGAHIHNDSTTIYMPNGGFIQYGTRVAPIVVERTYIPNNANRPMLSYGQQQSNLRLLEDTLATGVSSTTDLGFGYLVPGPGGSVFYHSKSGNMAPMSLEQFLESDEYFYLTGKR